MRDHLDVLRLGLGRHLLAAGQAAAQAEHRADRGTALVLQQLLELSLPFILSGFRRGPPL
jgi:hypothetical protein